MAPSRFRIAFLALALVLSACSGTATSSQPAATLGVSGPTASQVQATPTATATATPSPAPSTSASLGPIPSGFDPCTLLSDQEASAVNGVTYGDGVMHVLNLGFVDCVWQSPAGGSVVVQLLQAPSADLAQEAYVEAQATLHGFTLTTLSGFADEAVIARAPGGTVSTGGIYVRDGSTYFDVVYVGGTAPSDGALQLAATLVLGALP